MKRFIEWCNEIWYKLVDLFLGIAPPTEEIQTMTSEIVLPEAGSRWRIGETEVVVNSVLKRGRGYQVYVRTDEEAEQVALRLKDFTKKATRVDA